MCNTFIRSIPVSCIESNKQIVVCKDQGSPRIFIKLRVKEAEKKHTYRIKYDGCAERDNSIEKCDFIVLKVEPKGRKDCLITIIAFCELKGGNVEKALEQVYVSVQRISKELPDNTIYRFYIATTKSPRTYIGSKPYRNLTKAYGKESLDVNTRTVEINF